jgi:apolipoprotein D and lipocalin family protein
MLDSVADFNLTEYVRAPWFIQQQQPLVYQPASQLFCVRAQYIPVNPSNFSAGISVLNYANNDTVNGPAVGSVPGLGAPIVAFPAGEANSSTGASKLAVGIVFALPAYLAGDKSAFGPYWVVAVGTDPATGQYTWAIVSAGLPTVPFNGACRTGEPGATGRAVNGEGLWLFSRKQVDTNNTALMLQKAKDLGYDTSVLLPVEQKGCTYAGSEVPANFTSPLAMGPGAFASMTGPGPFAG